MIRISPLPIEPQFLQVFGQVKRNWIGYDRIVRISPLPRAPVFAGVLGPVKNNIIGSYVDRPAGQSCKVAGRSWRLGDVCVDGTTVILSGTFSMGSYV